MLDRLLPDVAKVVKICVIVVDVSDSREVEARNLVLHYCEVSEIRHKVIYHCGQRVSIWILGCFRIKIHYLLIARAGLKKEARSHRASSLDVDHKTYLVKCVPVVLPHSLHSDHSDLLSICEEHLHSLRPVVTGLQEMVDCLKDHTHSITVICSTV